MSSPPNAQSEEFGDAVCTGSFKYMAASTQSTLFRNGKVLTRRDEDGSDASWTGVDLENRQMSVQDARRLEATARCTLTHHGFEMREYPLAPNLNFLEHDQVVERYFPQCVEIVREVTGASFVTAFDYNIRSATGKETKQRIKGGQQVQGPAHVVHGDYTLTSAPQRLRDLTNPAGENDALRTQLTGRVALLETVEVEQILSGGRFAMINVWRNIDQEPVATQPLALCAAASVKPEDLIVFEIHYQDRIGENYFSKHADRHQWYYYRGLRQHEALLIKQWDSWGELARSDGARSDSHSADGPCTFSFHSAFEDPGTPPDAPDRWSIEVRCVALYG